MCVERWDTIVIKINIRTRRADVPIRQVYKDSVCVFLLYGRRDEEQKNEMVE